MRARTPAQSILLILSFSAGSSRDAPACSSLRTDRLLKACESWLIVQRSIGGSMRPVRVLMALIRSDQAFELDDFFLAVNVHDCSRHDYHSTDCRRLREEPQISAKSLFNRPQEPLFASVSARSRAIDWDARPDGASFALPLGRVCAALDATQPRVSRLALSAHVPIASCCGGGKGCFCCCCRCSHK